MSDSKALSLLDRAPFVALGHPCGHDVPCERTSPSVCRDARVRFFVEDLADSLRRQQSLPTIRAIQEINAARSARWMAGTPGWTTLEIAGELAGEVGELANVCKKLRRSELGVPGNKISDEELMKQAASEAADVFIVLMLTCSKLGIDLQDAVAETFNRKSEQMGFPERIGEGAHA